MRAAAAFAAAALAFAALVGALLWRAAEPDELQRRFSAAVALQQHGKPAEAAQAWQQVLALAPRLPEAYVNLGFALVAQRRGAEARAAFERATELRPEQANAYYGLALAYEAAGDLPLAIGAMRSYLHLARQESEEHLRRARAALWEWESAARR
jgi:tetratricopeptide (TPR) repeat protein